MPRPSKDTEQLSIQIPVGWLGRADLLSDAEDGAISRNDVLRRAMAIGLLELEDERVRRLKPSPKVTKETRKPWPIRRT